jgi:hypothetical protein
MLPIRFTGIAEIKENTGRALLCWEESLRAQYHAQQSIQNGGTAGDLVGIAGAADKYEKRGDAFLFSAVTDPEFPQFIQGWKQYANEPVTIRMMPEQVFSESYTLPLMSAKTLTLNEALLPYAGSHGLSLRADAGKLLAKALTDKILCLWKALGQNGYIPQRDAEPMGQFRDIVWQQVKKPLPQEELHPWKGV